MPIYLTPAAISYLSQLILALAITGFLVYRFLGRPRAGRPAHALLLAAFFAAVTVLVLLFFLENSFPPERRLYVVYLENSVVGLVLVFLLQFAYHFPTLPEEWEGEAGLALWLSLWYMVWEMQYAAGRFSELLGRGQVYFRPGWPDQVMVLLFLWAPVVLLRQAAYAPAWAAPSPWLRRLWKPQGPAARTARAFALVYLLPVGLSLTNYLVISRAISTDFRQMTLSVGLLVTLAVFALVHLNSLPETTTFMVKLVGVALATLLAVLGAVGWLIAPTYVAGYHPPSPQGQTLRFTPNAGGGYDVAAVAYSFDANLGDDLDLLDVGSESGQVALPYTFPFYRQVYREIYVVSDGAVGVGAPIDPWTIQYHYGTAPAIFALYMDVFPRPGTSAVLARRDADRLMITWRRVATYNQPETTYTFQLVLHPDGVFEVSYQDMPPELSYQSGADPRDAVWVIGAVPGAPARPARQFDFTALPVSGGPEGIMHDYYLDFRRHLHTLFAPLALLIVGSSLFILVGFPLLVYFNLVRPLNALLAGVRRVDAGALEGDIPIQFQDEIGFLTRAFNDMTKRLADLVHNLEARVAERTATLDATNIRLRAEIVEREEAQATVVAQQRSLAALEEREQLGRELHDGLGQALGYINVQAQAVETLLSDGQVDAARANLRQLAQASREAHADVRAHILGLRVEAAPRPGLRAALQAYGQQFQARYGLLPLLDLPPDLPDPLFEPGVEEQVLRLVQEALTNAGKHAAAGRVEVALRLVGDQVQVVVADDGRGFDPAPLLQREGRWGLTIMRERIEQIGGRLEVRSAPGQGTRVEAVLPRFLPPTGAGEETQIRGLRVLLADDHPLFLDGLRNLLRARGVTVVGTARSGREAVDKARALRPDVAVLDLNMPDGSGLEATRAIKAELPEVRVVILTVSEDEGHLFEAIKSGASGYLLKSLEANQFCALLAGLLRGEAALAPGMAERLLAEFARPAGRPPEALSARQLEILRLVAAGQTYKEIGAALCLTEKTVKYHMAQILERLHLENRAQAIAYLQRREGR